MTDKPQIPKGGFAFPVMWDFHESETGMTLRDYAAIRFAPIMTFGPDLGCDPDSERFKKEARRAARAAYALADSMLEARDNG